jgi:hypothetical protein
MIEVEIGGRARVINEGDTNWGYTALRLTMKATKTKVRIRRSTDEDRERRLRQGIKVFETNTLHDELEGGYIYNASYILIGGPNL